MRISATSRAASRCPFCLGDLDADAVPCGACGTILHRGCWNAALRCREADARVASLRFQLNPDLVTEVLDGLGTYTGPPLWGEIDARSTRSEVIARFGWPDRFARHTPHGVPCDLIYERAGQRITFRFDSGAHLGVWEVEILPVTR